MKSFIKKISFHHYKCRIKIEVFGTFITIQKKKYPNTYIKNFHNFFLKLPKAFWDEKLSQEIANTKKKMVSRMDDSIVSNFL